MQEAAIAGPGHNQPPNEIDIKVENLNVDLLNKTLQLRSRFDDLCASAGRTPESCDSHEMAGKFGDLIKLITACHKSFEGMRVAEKEPFLTLERAVDGFFKQYTETLLAEKKRINVPLDKYLAKKEDDERLAREEQARIDREAVEAKAREAAALAQANMPQQAEKSLQEASRLDEQAFKSEKAAAAKPAELSRTRGSYGSVSSLRTKWVGEIVDKSTIDLEALRAYLTPDAIQKALNLAVNAGIREIKGAKIYETRSAQVR